MRFRAPVAADAPAVLAVFEARDLADLGATIHTLEDLLDEWKSSDLDLERGARVAEEDGRIVAYAAVRRPGTLAVVAPDHEGRGIGSQLLEWAEERDRERGREVHSQWVAAGNRSARELLTRAGYHRARSYWRMVRSLDDARAAAGPPPGVHVRPVDRVRDARALHALDAASFADAPDYLPMSFTQFRAEILGAHDFDPGLSRVIVQEGEIVGCLLARRKRDGRVVYVDLLAVHPGHQRRGLGMALLQSAFAAFAQDGLREAQLGVASDNPQGLRLYERAGMTVRHRFDIYERPARPQPSRWRSFRDVDAAGDPVSLAEQLEGVGSVSFVAAEKRRSLELLGLAPGASVLDVGCGTGSDLAALAAIVGPTGRVAGLERSAALIAAARAARRDGGPIELVRGDAQALPFADCEFDACRADRTLQHLERPEVAISEMVRTVRPGGRVVVSESRWGLVAPSLDQELTDHILGLLASEAEREEWLGGRLEETFAQAGLSEVSALSADYTADEREELLRFTHLPGSLADAVRAGALAEDTAAAWLAQLGELAGRGEALALVLFLHVAGTKPPRAGQ
jgi:mycothiol synthase